MVDQGAAQIFCECPAPGSELAALAEGGMGGLRASDKVREALLLSHRVQEGPLAF